MLLCIFFCKHKTVVGSKNCFSVKVTGSQRRWNSAEGTNKVSWAHLQCQAGFCSVLTSSGCQTCTWGFSLTKLGCSTWSQTLHLHMPARPGSSRGAPERQVGSALRSALLLSPGTSAAPCGTAPHPKRELVLCHSRSKDNDTN